MALSPTKLQPKLLFFVTEDWYFASHRLQLAIAAQNAGYAVTVLTRVREHGALIQAAGLRLLPFEMDRSGVNPLADLFTIARLIAVYRRERFDIVHHVALKPVLYGSIAASASGCVRQVNALAGMGWLFSSGTVAAKLLKIPVRKALAVMLRRGITVVQNPDDARLLEQSGIPNRLIRRIPGSGVDLDHFAPQPEPEGIPRIVLPARLLWPKGVGEFVAAARLLRNHGTAAEFILAGSPDPGNPSSVSEKQLLGWANEGVVTWLGCVRDMPRLLAESAIVCLPSFYGEGIPKCLVEAAAAARPIVTTDMPGCREIVRHEDNGLIVPPKNPDALAAALERLISNPGLRRQLGVRGRRRAEAEFGIDAIIAQTLAVYREAAP